MQITFFPHWESNPVCWTESPALYCFAIKPGLYHKAVQVCDMPTSGDIYDALICNDTMDISSKVGVCFKTFSTKKNKTKKQTKNEHVH